MTQSIIDKILNVPADIATQTSTSTVNLARDIASVGGGDNSKKTIDNIDRKIPKSENELKRKTETAMLGFIETVQPEILQRSFIPVLLSLINTGNVPPGYPEANKKAAAQKTQACLSIIQEYRKALLAYHQNRNDPKSRTDLAGESAYAKFQLKKYLPSVCLLLELPEDAFADLARDHLLWYIRDFGVQVLKKSKPLAGKALGVVIGILDAADTVRFAVRDNKTRKYLSILLDNMFYGAKSISGLDRKQREATNVPQIGWTGQGKARIRKKTKNVSEQFMENYIMKNTNEGFMKNMLDKALGRSTDDDLKKRGAEFGKAVAAEEFFQLDDGRSQGAKGLILSMLDAMTPDHNVEYKGAGVEEGDAVDYVRGYLKKSWLGEIDAQLNKGKSEDADFAKYIDSNAFGEKITFNSLIQATTELYDRLRAEKMFEADIMLKYYSVPAGLLFYCLRNLGRGLIDMKKRYDKKRTDAGIEENKIFENYFKQNLKEEDVNLDVDSDTDLGQMVATMVNQALNTLEDTNPAKNRQTGLDMITQIRQKLQDPAVVGQIIEDEVQKMLAELA